MTETVITEEILEQMIHEKMAMLPVPYHCEPLKTNAEWSLWEIGLRNLKYNAQMRLPPFQDCKLDLKECETCGDEYICPVRTMEIPCPKCGKKGFVMHANEESGWRFVCVACEHPFDRYKKPIA